MEEVDKNTWNSILEDLRSEVTADEFSLVIQEIRFRSFKKGMLRLVVNSEFLRDRITSLYLRLITEKTRRYVKTEGADEEILVNVVVEQKPARQGAQREAPLSMGRPTEARLVWHEQLNSRYTFDSFVIGDNNRYAANAAFAIAKSPGTDYNPFLVYGGVGLGKTHLIQAIGNRIYKKYQKMKIIFVTAESFTNEFIQAIKKKVTAEFKNKYRYADLLLIDDIHFLQRKQETQEEIFHTFNALYDIKKQMVFTCDRPVKEIQDITDRLRDRFGRGLTVDLQPPSYETRVAILRKKVEEMALHKNISLKTEILEYIADKVVSNIRDLEAALLRLIGYTELVNKNITLATAEEQLKDIVIGSSNVSNVSIEYIQRKVAEYFSISRSDIVGKKRTKPISFPRQLSVYIIRKITNYSFTEIGTEFGGRDHSTIMYLNEQIQERLKTDPTLNETITLLVRRISSTWKP